jgi:hypothetical protein
MRARRGQIKPIFCPRRHEKYEQNQVSALQIWILLVRLFRDFGVFSGICFSASDGLINVSAECGKHGLVFVGLG